MSLRIQERQMDTQVFNIPSAEKETVRNANSPDVYNMKI